MKILAIVLAAVVLTAGAAVPMALAQQDASSQQSAPAQSAPAPADKAPAADAPKPPDTKVDVDIKADRGASDSAGSASPRTGAERTGFFGLSPTAAIIVSVAVLLVVILAIVAMTNSRGTTYIDRDRGL
jgi:amino acid transporter